MAKDNSTEEKIKEAARVIFQKKGYDATRTRDIAEMSGINLALLNYYFRSKRKLFDQIMLETIHSFLSVIFNILEKKETTVRQKLKEVVDQYIDLLKANPNLPIFVLSEVRSHPQEFVGKIGIKEKISQSVFVEQFFEEIQNGTIKTQINPIHILFNIASMIVFPFAASPMILEVSGMETSSFNALMDERRTLIPKWIESMLN